MKLMESIEFGQIEKLDIIWLKFDEIRITEKLNRSRLPTDPNIILKALI